MYRLEQLRDAGRERGATSTEYALVAGFIAVVFAVGAAIFGGDLRDFYDQLAAAVAAHMPTP